VSGSVEALVLEAAAELNDGLAQRVPTELGAEAPLFGADGVLDSMGLVQLVLALEDLADERFGIAVSLADRRAVSQTSSPFRTIGTLAAFLEMRLREGGWPGS
jgi:D-alanine--poly(phosphoribitol) ligase subunit 2